MKKYAAYIFLPVLSLVAGACAQQDLSYRMAELERFRTPSDTLADPLCASMNFRYPVFSSPDTAAAGRANRGVAQALFGPRGEADALCADFFGRWESYRAQYEQDDDPAQDDDEPVLLPWHYAATLEVQGRCRGLLSLVYTVSTDAHLPADERGFSRKYFVLEEKSGRFLSASDVFSDTTAVRRLITAVFLRTSNVSPEMSLQEQGIVVPPDGLLPLTDDFALDEQGDAVFRYDMQAIAPTVFSEDELQVPGAWLETLFKNR